MLSLPNICKASSMVSGKHGLEDDVAASWARSWCLEYVYISALLRTCRFEPPTDLGQGPSPFTCGVPPGQPSCIDID